MIDFTNLPIKKKTYAGANGSKICVVYEDEPYMLKFPGFALRNKELSYANGCISEYIGCHIFASVGIDVQKTLLGVYKKNSQDFASHKNTIIDSAHNGYGTELEDIENTILWQTAIPSEKLLPWFWDMFIVDALIGNWDRHNGNWGFLYDTLTDEMQIAPIFDCGSCLFPLADESIMREVLMNKDALNFRIFEIPLSGIRQNNTKINYIEFLNVRNRWNFTVFVFFKKTDHNFLKRCF